jgi:solute:Na+ symporter, SSS family
MERMHGIDYAIIAVFMLFVFGGGLFLGRGVQNVKGYFNADRNLPWWAVMLSIVAAETSVLTFLSIPGLAYLGNFTFLQVTVGYLLGRTVIAIYFLPMYAEGNFISVYEAVREKGGITMQRVMSITFMFTRLLADGVRLFAVAIPLSMIAGFDYMTSIWILGIVSIFYTWFGGIRSVVWMDVAQWMIYITAAVVALGIGLHFTPNLSALFSGAWEAGKFQIFDISLKSNSYTIFSGLLGGALLSMASHGTDQLIVLRILSCKTLADSRKALVGSGIVVIIQFALFLVIGAMLWLFWNGQDLAALGLTKPDELFTKFIIEKLPPVVKGITVAGIFAAAMSTLSGSLSALSSSTTIDIIKPLLKKELSEAKFLKIGRMATLVWGIVMVGGASLFTDMNTPLVELGLAIASFTYGGMLGIFLLVRFYKKVAVWQYVVTFFGTILTMVFIITQTTIHWTWYTLIGVISALIIHTILLVTQLRKQS